MEVAKSMLASARELHHANRSVIPLKPRSKEAAVKWEAYQSVGPTSDEVEQWFSNGHDYNIAIVTGSVSGIVVLDVDKPELLSALGTVPKTPTVKTGRGHHYYFRYPDAPVANTKLSCGDFLADRKMAVAPPSVHPSGAVYEWEVSPTDTPYAEMPDWLLKLTSVAPVIAKAADNDNTVTTAYGKAWFQDVENLARAQVGGRNDLLNTVACKAGSLIASGHLNEDEARSAMMQACKQNGLVHEGVSGVRATIKSGIEEGKKNPRYPLDVAETVATVDRRGKLTIQKLSDVKLEKIDWLWPGVIAKGKLAMFSGHGGVGKSTVVADLAARITTGREWPVSKARAEIGNVVILQLEDGVGDTLKARFLAGGGDPNRVHVISTVTGIKGEVRPFNFKDDIDLLTDAVRELTDVRLIVIDPIMGYMGDLNPDKAAEVRKLTTPLAMLAESTNAAILIVAHSNKSEDKKAINSVQGSGAFVQAVRTVYTFVRDENVDGRRIMAPVKSNISMDDESRAYTIEARQVTEDGLLVETSGINWEGNVHKGTAEDALRNNRDGGGRKTREAEDFLRFELRKGPRKSEDLRAEATQKGISKTTLYKAAESLVTKSRADSVDYWSLSRDSDFVEIL